MEAILHLDHQLFYLINHTLSNALLDALMPWFRDKYFWIPLYALVLAYLIYLKRQRIWVVLPLAALTLTATDQLAASVIKPMVQRPRPCHDVQISETVRLLVDCGPSFSFVSAHAANAFGIATFLVGVLWPAPRWFTLSALTWASLVALAQVYVGVHFPADVLAGAMLGIATGWLMANLCRYLIGWLWKN